jgi:predicted transport protein
MRLKKHYIAFCRKQGFVSFIFSRSKLKAYLNIKIDQLQDLLKKSKDIEGIGHYSTDKTEIIITDRNDISYSIPLIKKHTKEVKKELLTNNINAKYHLNYPVQIHI